MKPVLDPTVLAQLEGGGPRAVRDPVVLANLEYGLDLTKGDDEVRAGIARLPETEKHRAHDIWAEHRVRKFGMPNLPDAAGGIPIVGPYLDEATAGLQAGLNLITNGRIGMPYDEALAFERARKRAEDAKYPAAGPLVRFAAGVATGGPVLSRVAQAATLAGRAGQGALIGGTIGAAEGFGAGEGSFGDRLRHAADSAQTGAALGAVLPVATAGATRAVGAVTDLVSPTFTRLRRGPAEAADEILARRIADEGASPAAKRLDLQSGQQTARLAPNSQAALPETIADTSDAMRRLTGSVYRQGGEAGDYVREQLTRRQRGPENPYAPRPQGGGPDGQMARVMDTTERALLLRSSGSAYQTEQRIMREQAAEGRRLYDQARREGFDPANAFDIQPAIDGLALTAQQYPGAFRARLLRAVNLFRDDSPQRWPVNTIERFDAAKKALDDMIQQAQRGGQGNLVRELSQFRGNLLEHVHMGGKNTAYAEARQAWGSAAENREAIQLGRDALREGSEVAAEQYRQLTRGQQQLFRLGFLDSLRGQLSTKRPGNDVTQLFQQQRVQELMNEIIPRPAGRTAVFSNRGERFGEVMRREGRMVQTNNEVLGNSKTAQRHQDDLQFAGNTLAGMWDRFRSSPSLFNMGVEAIGAGIQRVFGYNQAVALQLAHRLLETDPTARNQLLRRLATRGGPDVFQRFADHLDRSANVVTGSAAGVLAIEGREK